MNARLDHPNIVTVFEVNNIEDHSYISMALVDGPNLRQFMQDRPLPVPQAVRIMIQVADAVAHAHSRGSSIGISNLKTFLLHPMGEFAWAISD